MFRVEQRTLRVELRVKQWTGRVVPGPTGRQAPALLPEERTTTPHATAAQRGKFTALQSAWTQISTCAGIITQGSFLFL